MRRPHRPSPVLPPPRRLYAPRLQRAELLRDVAAADLDLDELLVILPTGQLILLARELLIAGFSVHAVDASPAMIELARDYAHGARVDVLRLPTGLATGADAALPESDAVVSTGHVLNYLDTRDDIAQALGELARAVRAGGVLAIDLMTARFAERRDISQVHAKVTDDWAIVTRFSRPAPHRFDRRITVFRRSGDGWRRSDEHHRNVTFEVDDALRVLRDNGIDAHPRAAFGDEKLPEGLIVLTGVRKC